VADRLAAFKRPRLIEVFDAMPRTNTGKPALAEIRARIERHMKEEA